MDNNLELLHEKIDYLTQQIEVQQNQIEKLENSDDCTTSKSLDKKLDLILKQLNTQKQKQDEFDELKNDLIPIGNHIIKLTIDELAEVGSEFQLEDLLFLVKRLLRDTHLLVELLDRIESTAELAGEVQMLGTQVFNEAVVTLDKLEQDGYFNFARSFWLVLQRVVEQYDQEDIENFADNIVPLITTGSSLTQPEFLNLVDKTLEAIKKEPTKEETSLLKLIGQLSDPELRKGLVRLLNIVKVFGEQQFTLEQN